METPPKTQPTLTIILPQPAVGVGLKAEEAQLGTAAPFERPDAIGSADPEETRVCLRQTCSRRIPYKISSQLEPRSLAR